MVHKKSPTNRESTGVSKLDRILGGLFIGDNVVWHDENGSLAYRFCLTFIQTSLAEKKPLVYVSFDRSPKNLLDKLGPLAENKYFTILDCFTSGKGDGSPVFLKFYDEPDDRPCTIVKVDNPRDTQNFMDALYGLHANMNGHVHFVFESITGMQELWGGEDHVLNFYSRSCPRLYELNTIAYWIMEKNAHSSRFRAQINKIAQVAVDLSIKRGTTFLTVLKAERRSPEDFYTPFKYWAKDQAIVFDSERRSKGGLDLGLRLKELRTKRGISQSELAKLVGVTPSTISQVESNLIYPSLPALLKMAEVLSTEVSYFLQESAENKRKFVFPASNAVGIMLPELPENSIAATLLTLPETNAKIEPYLIEIPPQKTISSHFFIHKGDELGYVLSGKVEITVESKEYALRAGDLIHLVSEVPTHWRNSGRETARLLWVKIN